MNLRPEPRHTDVTIETSELSAQQRVPKHVVRLAAELVTQPLVGGIWLQALPVFDALHSESEKSHPDPLVERYCTESQQIEGCRGAMEPAVDIRAHI